MRQQIMIGIVGAVACVTSQARADALVVHRIPAALAAEAVSEAVASCASQGYRETAVMVDADGVTIAALRGDGTGAHSLDSAHDKAFTSASFKTDTLAMEERGRGEAAPLSKLTRPWAR
jgi:uncharacterized protein GlcG (DUF336 family)